MPNCAVASCSHHNRMKDASVKFYSFPKNKDLAMQWSNACLRKHKINMKNAAVCSKHFEEKYFFVPLKYKLLNVTVPTRFRNLRDDAIPTLFLPKSSTTTTNPLSNNCRKRFQRKQEKNDLENGIIETANILAVENYSYDNQPECQIGETEESNGLDPLEDTNEATNELENIKIKMLSMEKEMESLKLKNEDLVNQNMILNLQVSQYHAGLSNHFTPGQIKRILGPNQKFPWDSKDIASAISLTSVSPKAYRYLRKNGYPLPDLSTLRRSMAKKKNIPRLD